ncbi:MAG TPA: hypothetical protein VGN20_12270 [Mucilaginibacter sp.]|jgi:hypothetical protein
MKKSTTLLVCILFCLSCLAQGTSCDFLKNIKFKNGVDTFTVKATFLSLLQLRPPLVSMVSFYKKQKLTDEIEFRPENCSTSYVVPLKAFEDKEGLFSGDNLGLNILLTCVIFEKYLHSDIDGESPFFIVIKAVPQRPIGSKSTATNDTLDYPKFSKNPTFKNGTDTIVLKANYISFYKPGAGLILKELEKKKLIDAKNYEYGIDFEIADSKKRFIAAHHFKDKTSMNLLEKQPEGTIIYLTCVFYQGYYIYGEPFFIIDKLDTKDPRY